MDSGQGHCIGRESGAKLRALGSKMVHFTSEHFGFRSYLFRHFFKTISIYDVHIHTFDLSKRWLEENGARKVGMSEFGYDPHLHRPPSMTKEERERFQSEVLFIGHYEPSTEKMIVALKDAGISVKLYGSGWRSRARRIPGRRQIRKAAMSDYVKLLASAKICLCFLSKWNNNTLHPAGRTFEIPAIGSFLLAERTRDHLSYYREGQEAEIFQSPEELIEKIKHYLSNDEKMKH